MYTYTQTKRHALHINTHTPSPPLPLSVCLMITPDEVCDFTTQLVRVGVACRGIGAARSTRVQTHSERRPRQRTPFVSAHHT